MPFKLQKCLTTGDRKLWHVLRLSPIEEMYGLVLGASEASRVFTQLHKKWHRRPAEYSSAIVL